MHVNEYELPVRMTNDQGTMIFTADPASLSAGVYPKLQYRMRVEGADAAAGDETALADGIRPGDASLVTLELGASPEWTLTIQGRLDGEEPARSSRGMGEEIADYREFFRETMNGFRLSRGGESADDLFKVNALAWWYTHNMLVHYAVPHGLEQYGGAAWGTGTCARDRSNISWRRRNTSRSGIF